MCIMKYFLAFKKVNGNGENDDFTLIKGNLIHKELDTNNNLKALCFFTGRYADEIELKATIIRLNPAFKDNEDDELVIAWKRLNDGVEEINYNSIIYSYAFGYLNFDNLVDLLVSKAYDQFFDVFFNHYQGHSYLARELNALYEAVKKGASYNIIEARMRFFLNRALCGKSGLEYAKLYKMVVFISNALRFDCSFLEKGSSHRNTLNRITGTSELRSASISETEEFEAEWLETRARLREKGEW